MSEKQFTPGSHSLPFVEQLYADYLEDLASVPRDWRRYFEAHLDGHSANGGAARIRLAPSFKPRSIFNPTPPSPTNGRTLAAPPGKPTMAALQDRLDQLVRAYRVRGHMIAQVDPLAMPRPAQVELEPEYYGFGPEHLDQPFSSRTIAGPETQTLRQIVQRLRNTYCRYIGVQFMHIDHLDIRHWIQDRVEGSENRLALSRKEQYRILTRLTDAVVFEEFIQKKYVGAKSFSLEGCESVIPLLDLAIVQAGEHGIDEIVIGMAHRGRLNVLANIMGKAPQEIFREFDEAELDQDTSGDVKYHLGYSTEWETVAGRKIHLSLCFNPSHLEFINPVALGRMRAKQDRWGDTHGERGMVILVHGDAAFAGEGVVQETLNLSELAGYRTGGTIHVIVNNQIGFTTPPNEGRSSIYASAVAKMLQIPIFHVNGEDPESVAQVIRVAMDFRRQFRRDVVIDMWGYRRHGHNEGDEPSFTQPVLYKAIRARPPLRASYLEHLLTHGGINAEQGEALITLCRERLEKELAIARQDRRLRPQSLTGYWEGYVGGADADIPEVETGVAVERLQELLAATARLPADFHLHAKLKKFISGRLEMAAGQRLLDWSAGEALALATLATGGHRVRISGQDSGRGTFSHRHAVLHDTDDGHTFTPLQHLAAEQAPVSLINSPLSEIGVLGFEYGYSLDYPDALVLWEAQFGDFVNVAQVVIDQFIASAEDKWRRLSGVGLLLPHGFEGQGPEHSSARIERFLQLAAKDNMQIVVPSTPAQIFHLLRRQVLRKIRKPLIVFTPKSLLRHPRVVSELAELAAGTFQRILGDPRVKPKAATRVLLCCGKVYYELLERREELKRADVSIVRVEQLYPLPEETLRSALSGYAKGTPVIWVQEEPANMGAWRYLKARFGDELFGRLPLHGITRPESASPATGFSSRHKREQEQLMAAAFGEIAGTS